MLLLLEARAFDEGGTEPGDSTPGYAGWGAALFISLALLVVR